MLIVPDVHGREFWKGPLISYPDDPVIFLGDYLDPYDEEGISREKAIEVFMEIIALKKKEPTRITLLLGNHDLMYISSPFRVKLCRHDMENDTKISKIFKDNLELFKLIESKENYIFSHAGIHRGWLNRHPEFGDSIKTLQEILNSKPLDDKDLGFQLNEYSWWRGGDLDCHVGSPVWSDVREWIHNEQENPENVIQIFGHTQLKDGKIIEGPGYKCIDCKHVIKINNNKLDIL